MLFRTPPTILLQIFCEFMIIFKSIIGPDDTCKGRSSSRNGFRGVHKKGLCDTIYKKGLSHSSESLYDRGITFSGRPQPEYQSVIVKIHFILYDYSYYKCFNENKTIQSI